MKIDCKYIAELLETKYIDPQKTEKEQFKDQVCLWQNIFNLALFKIKTLERKGVDIK